MMTLKASITQRGAVLLGQHVACDSHDDTRPVRIVTHAHYDHYGGLGQSLQKCQTVIMTPATRDLLAVMQSPLSLKKGHVHALKYGQPWKLADECLTLHRADHILGAAQVMVEDKEGTRIVYTGDFRLANTPVLEADIVVLEATYGNPSQVRPFRKVVEKALISLVESALKTGPVQVFGYHGKLQEVMQILHKNRIIAPFIATEKVYLISKICEGHGMQIGKLLLAGEEEADEITDRNQPHVAFYHMNAKRYVTNKGFRISVSGWEFSGPKRQIGENEHVVALSDHADFKELLSYVKESKPKLVITDNYRVGDARGLAREIEKRLGIPARALPQWDRSEPTEPRRQVQLALF
jgi:putative mRNA 3-end processing factor